MRKRPPCGSCPYHRNGYCSVQARHAMKDVEMCDVGYARYYREYQNNYHRKNWRKYR